MTTQAVYKWLALIPTFIKSRLADRPNLQKVLGNTGWLMGERLTRMLLGLIVGAWVARYLGPAQFGELSYALAFTVFFQAVANLGLDGIVVRDIASMPEKSSEILGTALRLRICSGVLAWCAAMASVLVIRSGDTQALILVALVACGTIFQSADTVDLWFQSQSQSRRTVIVKLVTMFITNGIKIGLILYHSSVVAFAAVQLLEVALGAVSLMWAYRKFPASAEWIATWQTAKQLLHESWPLLLGGISVVIYMRINQLMLREMVGERELGIYSAVLPFAEVWNFIPVTICTSIAPLMARQKVESDALFYESLQKLFSILTFMAVLIAISVAIASPSIVNMLLGPKFKESVPVLAIQAFAAIPIFSGVAQSIWIINERKSRLALIKTISGAISSVILNLILIPTYGAKGAAFATVVSQLISAVLSNGLLAPRIFKMQLRFYRVGLRK